MSIKQDVLAIARSMGFERTVIGSLEPMEAEREDYQRWLDKGYAAGMEYLKRNPHFRTSPQLLYPGSTSAIIVSVSYYTEPPVDPGPRFGQVANYAVGLDYHVVIRAKLRELKARIEEKIKKPIFGKAFTDDVALFEQGYASRHGLGFAGKNSLIIGPKLSGSYHFIAELFSDLDLEPDEPFVGTCGACFRCGSACPTNAIEEGKTVNANLCISYLTIENKGPIPLDLRPKLGRWVFGCDICQIVCPYNQRPPETPWTEFQPQSGKGHFIDLYDILSLQSDEEFFRRFVNTPLRRPKRKGLQRNALVVLGNCLSMHFSQQGAKFSGGITDEIAEDVAKIIFAFIESESDQNLIEQGIWALSQNPDFKRLANKLVDRLENPELRKLVAQYV